MYNRDVHGKPHPPRDYAEEPAELTPEERRYIRERADNARHWAWLRHGLKRIGITAGTIAGTLGATFLLIVQLKDFIKWLGRGRW
jgi:hypothetical protein